MKLRIRGNSIRLRLTKSEVNQFLNTGEIKDQIQFGFQAKDQLTYQLKIALIDRMAATYEDQKIVIHVPDQQGLIWANTEEVSIRETVNIGNDQQLNILVEKDFQCLQVRPNGEDHDTFPNPHA